MDIEEFRDKLYDSVRLTPDAEEYITSLYKEKKIELETAYERLVALNKPFLTREEVEKVFLEMTKLPPPVEVRRAPLFKPLAKEYEANVRVRQDYDVSGKSRSTGKIEDFVKLFNDRFNQIKTILRTRVQNGQIAVINVSDIRTISSNKKISHRDQRFALIAMISDKRRSARGNLVFEVEDETGKGLVVFMSDEKEQTKKAEAAMLDDIVMFEGRVGNNLFLASSIEYPEVPFSKEVKLIEEDLAVLYLSDLHIGSKLFLKDSFSKLIEWLNGRGNDRELAGKIKYIVIAGDIVDGIGIYPTQEEELAIRDIFKQYDAFNQLIESLPDYITVIVSPGNHDAVRRAEPQPKLPDDLLPRRDNLIKVGNPSWVSIEGISHLIYHGTSLDSIISEIPGLGYDNPALPMIELLRRRHLSPLYGRNPIVPELRDYLVIKDVPDVVVMGHIHKNAYTRYRNIVLFNAGTFQDRTEFQIKQGHMPTPGIVPIYELRTGEVKHRSFVKG
ncbi:DNA-directed DNA polymerase II small subunit [Candidatus Micrarchaeota archaeon]|nr:DNA-directed DNA polymerase II small subunit [Candidatus Micrarchaeota archaeon]